MRVAPLQFADVNEWAALRHALWPYMTLAQHQAEAQQMWAAGKTAVFLARNAQNDAVGFAEAALRHDYVNGCDTSPVAFLEGIYVRPEARRQGIARMLVAEVLRWARTQGCRELASDADVANVISHAMHRALGFEETERVVYFRKRLNEDA